MGEARDEVRSAAAPAENGVPRRVAEGVYQLRMALPFQLDHVNLWLIDEADGWSVIDAGYGDAPTKEAWEALDADWFGGKPIRRVIVTHFHPDHLGLAGWLCRRFDAALVMPRTEWAMGRMLSMDLSEDFVAAGRRFAVRAGLPSEVVEKQAQRGNRYRLGVSEPPAAFERLADGATIALGGEQARIVMAEGHAPEMATFYLAERNVLIAADQILPRISPNIGVWPSMPEENPLALFFGSLERFADLPDDALVLPSHDGPFFGLHARIRQLRAHHAQRLDRALGALDAPRDAAQVLKTLFPRALDMHQMGFAVGETLAHLHYLEGQGSIGRALAEDGRVLFARS